MILVCIGKQIDLLHCINTTIGKDQNNVIYLNGNNEYEYSYYRSLSLS